MRSCRRWTSWCVCSQATASRSSGPPSRSTSSNRPLAVMQLVLGMREETNMFNKRGTLALVCVATAMLMLDIAVVNTALPRIAHDLHSSLAGVQWVIDAYTLTLAAL